MSAPAVPPAGWYPDPEDVRRVRYWDGHQWTDHIHTYAALPFPPASGASSGLKAAGAVVAIILALSGLVAIAFFIFFIVSMQSYGSNK